MRRVIKSTTIADRLLLIVLLAGSLAAIYGAGEAVSNSSEVLIEADGKPLYSLPLAADRSVTVPGKEGATVVEVKDRKVRIREAHCPNQLCMKQGWVTRGVIICVPNRVVVTVGGRGGKPKPDAVTG